jgi:hyperosmotically inducible periplasmic protein
MRFVILMCTLATGACASSDNRPAEDVSSSSQPGTSATAVRANREGSDPTTTAASQASLNTTSSPTPSTAALPVDARPASTVGVTNSPPAPSGSEGAMNGAAAAHDGTANADNTKINDRDRHSTLTPMNQGNSGDETRITAAIRRGLMGDRSLSFTAKNVKIITVGTNVTLRGPVNSDQEKTAVEACATGTAGVTNVDDQLEVKK